MKKVDSQREAITWWLLACGSLINFQLLVMELYAIKGYKLIDIESFQFGISMSPREIA